MRTWIGCSGWLYPEWKECFYPAELPKSKWFQFYTEHFNSVEINYSFYRNVTKQNIIQWRDAAPANFCFTLKAN